VREAHRRRGVGRALVAAMLGWMVEHGAAEAWVLADNRGAEEFYAACGFVRDEEQSIQMTLSLS
jgi:GNAT superfamily N-acetyltransferase